MDEVGVALDTIPGIEVYPRPMLKVKTPCVVVSYPDEMNMRTSYGRGTARMSLPIVVMVGRPTDRSTRDRITKYAAGSGPESVTRIMDAYAWTTCDSVTVTDIDFDVVSMGDVPYLAAAFTLDIIGPGTT